MPDNAGTIVSATPLKRVFHLQYIDSEGKPRTDSYEIPTGATDAQLNTLVNAVGAITNANLWNVGITGWWMGGIPTKTLAVDATNDSVKDNLVLLMKTVTNTDPFDFFVPANNEVASMVAGTENPDPTTVEMIALIAAIEAVWAFHEPISYRFSERRLKNKAVKA
jgi:hypothetical protein